MPQIVFITFGGPTPNYHRRLDIICRQMREHFPKIKTIGFSEQDLKADPEFWLPHGHFMDTHPRGYGHWLWKPWIIYKTMQHLSNDDILIYADAGCTINPFGARKLEEYIKSVANNEFGLLAFTLTNDDMHKEYKWTKNATMQALNPPDEDRSSKQLMATTMIWKKTEHTSKFVKEWYATCSKHHLIDDTRDENEHPDFQDHRHDQSVFSLLVKKYSRLEEHKPLIIPDETYYWPDWHIDGIDYPIWATRFRS
jgi:hypothetical protein